MDLALERSCFIVIVSRAVASHGTYYPVLEKMQKDPGEDRRGRIGCLPAFFEEESHRDDRLMKAADGDAKRFVLVWRIPE